MKKMDEKDARISLLRLFIWTYLMKFQIVHIIWGIDDISSRPVAVDKVKGHQMCSNKRNRHIPASFSAIFFTTYMLKYL